MCSSHGLFNANAVAILEESPVDTVFVTNSVPLPEGCSSSRIEQVGKTRRHVVSFDVGKDADRQETERDGQSTMHVCGTE